VAPKVECRSSKNEKIAVIARGRLWCCAHHRCPLNGRPLATAPRITARPERTSKIGVPPAPDVPSR
jgi:hypothetical protein